MIEPRRLQRTFGDKKVIQHVLSQGDGKPLGIAVIWDEVPGPDDAWILAFVMATTPPNGLIGSVTDRMPAVIRPEHWGMWLGETDATLAEIKALLVPIRCERDASRLTLVSDPCR